MCKIYYQNDNYNKANVQSQENLFSLYKQLLIVGCSVHCIHLAEVMNTAVVTLFSGPNKKILYRLQISTVFQINLGNKEF